MVDCFCPVGILCYGLVDELSLSRTPDSGVLQGNFAGQIIIMDEIVDRNIVTGWT